ncbi:MULTISPECIES: type VII toxin-antitoxin system HepT family RNase toxin [unclassified Caloramator]|uniref:type VII toxin-antitoxin system HepT family RNase toxin n=1 Tax=unclassified Caloramator TaxID=2629145 RepID=UPI00237E0A2B|nr:MULTISPECIES: DUF86 domain-containing protein [unclassified Caloramator]MDO6354787.1 DUF86 domain-containing protein [Caloramator sp. CAR-1]WDU82469.1 DUF86 domain-containing protein [Caloramator sp. Dgby_cultured_2]
MILNIDYDKVRNKLLFIQENLKKLEELRNFTKEEFLNDFRNVDSAKYLLQTSIEAMLDIANHIIARNRWGKVESNRDSFEILYQNRIIDKNDIETYFLMAKFRNRIVHMYIEVDNETIYNVLQNNLKDIKRFVDTISMNI